MLKRMIQPCKTGILVMSLMLSMWSYCIPMAHAGVEMKTLRLDAAATPVEVFAVYETSFAAQKILLKSLKYSNKLMKKAVGFQGSAVLQGQDGKHIMMLSQWDTAENYQAYQAAGATDAQNSEFAQKSESKKSESKKSSSANGGSRTPTAVVQWQLVAAQPSVVGATPAIRGREAVVQFVHFTPNDAAQQAEVLTQVQAMVPTLLTQQPIPQAIAVLTGTDTPDVALMRNWNCSALFEDVGKPSAIAVDDSLAALASTEQGIYTVANIIPMEVKEPADEAE